MMINGPKPETEANLDYPGNKSNRKYNPRKLRILFSLITIFTCVQIGFFSLPLVEAFTANTCSHALTCTGSNTLYSTVGGPAYGGEVDWTLSGGAETFRDAAIEDYNGNIYLRTDSVVKSYTAAGVLRFVKYCPTNLAPSSLIFTNGLLYLYCREIANTTIAALRPSDGQYVWFWELFPPNEYADNMGPLKATPYLDATTGALVSTTVRYSIGGYGANNKVQAFGSSGQKLWSKTLSGGVGTTYTGTAFSPSGDVYYFYSYDLTYGATSGELFALRTTNGAQIWSITCAFCAPGPDGCGSYQGVVATESIVFRFTTHDNSGDSWNGAGRVIALNSSTGAELWTYGNTYIDQIIPHPSLPILVIHRRPKANIDILNTTTRTVLWTASFSKIGTTFLDTNNRLYISSADGNGATFVRQYDLLDGTIYGVIPTAALADGISISSTGKVMITAGSSFLNFQRCNTGTYSNPLGGCSPCKRGYFQDSSDQRTCKVCPPGTYSSVSGSDSCMQCGPGTYQSSPGSTSCLQCPVGSASNIYGAISLTNCTLCDAGYYSNIAGLSSCFPCPAATFSSTVGSNASADCQLCPPGTFGTMEGQVHVDNCTSCLAGSFSSSFGSQKCSLCPIGTSSDAIGSVSFTQCQECEEGTYNDVFGAESCKLCPVATYNPSRGNTSISACLKCPAGTYSLFFGQQDENSCIPCPPGSFSATAGTRQCSLCAPGTFSTQTGATSNSSCEPCASGYYSNTPGAASCLPCPPSTYNPTRGNSSVDACIDCPLGTFSYLPGRPSIAACKMCLPGSYNSETGRSDCSLCPAGTYGNIVGGTSIATCQDCPAGTYNPAVGQTQSACIPCIPGKFSNITRATTETACQDCLPGFFSDAASDSCKICPAGTFSDISGASSCSMCPRNTISDAEGSTNNATCAKCPDGYGTIVAGATSETDCVDIPFVCPPGSQLAQKNAATCIPLLCSFPLAERYGTDCAGCPPGTYGYVESVDTGTSSSFAFNANCSLCPANSLCPGLISFPLMKISNNVTSTSSNILSTACPASAFSSSCLQQESLSSSGSPAQSFSTLSSSTTSILFSIVIGVVTVLLSTFILAFPAGRKFIKRIDGFSIPHAIELRKPLKNIPSSCGGWCTSIALVVLTCLASILIIRRNADNVLLQSSLLVLDPDFMQLSRTATWASFSSQTGCGSSWSGIQILLVAQGEAEACKSPLSWNGNGLDDGNWILTASDCDSTDGRTLLFFSCPNCVFSGTSNLDIIMPYSCQSLFLASQSVAANGVVHAVSMPLSTTTATNDGFLASINWEISPLLAVQNDTMNTIFRRGYQIVSLSASSTTSKLEAVGNDDNTTTTRKIAIVKPAEASVHISIALPLQPFYFSTTITEKVSIIQLISSIIGLSGIFSAFGLMYQTGRTKKAHLKHLINSMWACACCIGRKVQKSNSSRKLFSEKTQTGPAQTANSKGNSMEKGAGTKSSFSFSSSSNASSSSRSLVASTRSMADSIHDSTKEMFAMTANPLSTALNSSGTTSNGGTPGTDNQRDIHKDNVTTFARGSDRCAVMATSDSFINKDSNDNKQHSNQIHLANKIGNEDFSMPLQSNTVGNFQEVVNDDTLASNIRNAERDGSNPQGTGMLTLNGDQDENTLESQKESPSLNDATTSKSPVTFQTNKVTNVPKVPSSECIKWIKYTDEHSDCWFVHPLTEEAVWELPQGAEWVEAKNTR